MRTRCSSHPHGLMLPTYWTDSANQICHLESPGGNPTGAEAVSSPEESRSGTTRGWRGPSRRLVRGVRVRGCLQRLCWQVGVVCAYLLLLFLGKLPTANGGRSHRRRLPLWDDKFPGREFPPLYQYRPESLELFLLFLPHCYQPVYQ